MRLNYPILLICAVFFTSLKVTAQEDCEFILGKATAPSGLILRTSPGKGFVKLIPEGDTLEYCASVSHGGLTFEGIEGDWRKVRHQGDEGYSFDGFIFELKEASGDPDSLMKVSQGLIAMSDSILGDSAIKSAMQAAETSPHKALPSEDFQFLIETYNYCGDVQAINLKMYWYGVFLDNELNPTGALSIRPLNLNVSLSKQSEGDRMEFDLLTDEDERSLFVFGLSGSYPYQSTNLLDIMPTISARGRRLFPGQEWILDAGSGTTLSATGSITKAGPCPEAENYSLKIRFGRGDDRREMDLQELIPDYGACAIPEIYWYGDLSGDGLPEIIFVSVDDDKNVFHFLRSEATASQPFSLQAVYTVENCATP